MFWHPARARLGLVAAVWLTACQGDAPLPGDLRDDAGRAISLDTPARRVVTLSPAITELMFAIGSGELVVGRTQWGEFPPAALDVPSIGDGLDPNIELIAAQRPDLVVMYASASNSPAIDRLDALGIRSFSLALDSLGSVERSARLLGALTGASASADELALRFRASLDSARQATPSGPGPRVVLLSWDNPPIVIGGTSFLSELVSLAGGQNVFADIAQPSATVTIETIVERNPDAFVSFAEDIPAFAERPEWQTVDAVRQRRFALVTGSEFSYPSPRALDAVRRLRAALDRLNR